MDTSVVGIYRSSSNVQTIIGELQKAGFTRDSIQLGGTQEGQQPSGGIAHSLKEETGLGEFFRRMYGSPETMSHWKAYEQAASQGNVILTVHASSEEQAHRAADVMERYDPIDVEEYAAGESSSGAATSSTGGQAGMRQGQQASSVQSSGIASPMVSSGMQDEIQKGRSQSTEAAATAGPSGTGKAGAGMSSSTGRQASSGASSGDAEAMRDDVQKGRPMDQRKGIRMFQQSSDKRMTMVPSAAQKSEGRLGDTHFRSHWQSTQASSGGTFDEYGPSYRYGSESRRSERWRGKQWSEVESDVRKDWETKNSKGMWERFKETVRYGWENPTGSYEDEARALSDRIVPGKGVEPGPEAAGQSRRESSSGGERSRPSTSAFPGTGTSTTGRPQGASMSGGMSTSGATFSSDQERSRNMSTPRDTRSGNQAGQSGTQSPMTSSDMQDDLQEGRSQSADAAESFGPSATASTGKGSGQARGARADQSEMESRTASSGMQDDVQKGRSQSTAAATSAGHSATTKAGGRAGSTSGRQTSAVSGGGAHVPDDAEYRSHWHHSHWISGGSYDDYAPAYRYGADYADNDTNPNHQWSDVEQRMRSDWLTYNPEPGSWEKNVEAIRYGWEKGKQRAKGTHSGESLRRR